MSAHPDSRRPYDGFRGQVARFLDDEIVPWYSSWEREGRIPSEYWARAADAGLLCRTVPVEYGGRGDDFFSSAIVIEELARRRLHGFMLHLHSDIVVPYLERFGSQEQKDRYLRPCASGRMIAAVAMTEPHSGSDLQSFRTTAMRRDDEFCIEGAKTHVSCGMQASLFVVAAKTEDSDGLTLLLVEAPTPGLEREPVRNHGLRALDTARLRFRSCRVPRTNVLGAEGMGLVYLVKMLAAERLVLAIAAQAGCRQILAQTVGDCAARSTRSGSVLSYQNTRFTLAELAAECTVNHAFVDRCISEQAHGGVSASAAAIAKLRTTELLKKIALAAVQLRGARGVTQAPDNPAAQDLMDACVQTIWGGTSEMMKEVIADDLEKWI